MLNYFIICLTSEQQQKNPLVDIDDLANLSLGECYTLFAEPTVRLSKIQTPEVKVKDKHIGFIQKKEIDNRFRDNYSFATPQEEQKKSVAENRKTENSGTSAEVKSAGFKTKGKKKIKQPGQKLKTQTIDNEKSRKIADDFTAKF